MTPLALELDQAKRRLSALILARPKPFTTRNPWVVEDQAQFVRELENMEGDTRFMPLTRQCLDHQQILFDIALIVEEIQAHIRRIRRFLPYVAQHREARLTLFALHPTIPNLRAIWLIREVPQS